MKGKQGDECVNQSSSACHTIHPQTVSDHDIGENSNQRKEPLRERCQLGPST